MAFLILLVQCVSAYYLQLGEIEFTNSEDYLNDRTTTLASGYVQNYYNAYYGSRNATGGADGIYGATYAGGQAYQGVYQSPSSQLGYFVNYAKWNANNPINGDYSSSTGFIATSYLKLEEIDSTGAVVQIVNLNTLPWTVGTVYTNGNASSVNLTGGVAYTGTSISAFGGGNNNNQQQQQNQQQATTLYGNLSVTLIVTVSSQHGLLFTGEGLLSSKSVGLDIEILLFPYVNTQNSIRFSEVVVTATVEDGISYTSPYIGLTRVVVGPTNLAAGYTGVYFDLSTNALVNGVKQAVSISPWSATYASLNNYKLYAIQLTAMAKLNRKINYFGYSIQFPAGASNITYSQVYGIGAGPDAVYVPPMEVDESSVEETSGAILGLSKEAFGGVVAGSVLGFAVVILALVLFIRSRKSSEYPAAINDTKPTDIPTGEQSESTGLVVSENQHTKYQALA